MKTVEDPHAFIDATLQRFPVEEDESKREENLDFWRAALLDPKNLSFIKLHKIATIAKLHMEAEGIAVPDDYEMPDERVSQAISDFVGMLSEERARELLQWSLEEAFKLPDYAFGLLQIAARQRKDARRLNARRGGRARAPEKKEAKRQALELWRVWHAGGWAGQGARPRFGKDFDRYVAKHFRVVEPETVEGWRGKWRKDPTI